MYHRFLPDRSVRRQRQPSWQCQTMLPSESDSRIGIRTVTYAHPSYEDTISVLIHKSLRGIEIKPVIEFLKIT